MDRVKFGRALGYGARHAAKTLVQAAEAASAPNPTPPSPPPQAVYDSRTTPGPRRVPDAQTVRAAGQRARSSLATPVVRFSSVVWLQVTGVFFAMVAFTMGMAAWRAWTAVHSAANSHGAIKMYAYIAVCALFTYFAVSSFARAARR